MSTWILSSAANDNLHHRCTSNSESCLSNQRRQDRLIYGALLTTLSPEVASLVSQTTTSHDLWTLLQRTYAKASRSHLKQLKECLHTVSKDADYEQLLHEQEVGDARAQIQELETERHSSKKKLEHFLKKVGEDRASWRSREHEKICAYVDDIKSELSRKRKSRQRIEIVNSRLVSQWLGLVLMVVANLGAMMSGWDFGGTNLGGGSWWYLRE
ncbi:hypothetical protein V8G54_010496 [Vigna mungo]|uniref:Uncharacterized protein n=1 Tax=Vigna mungo TaxID=3915 RepID=A0AAQ3S343_VIGMU